MQRFEASSAAARDDQETRYNLEIKMLRAIYDEIHGGTEDDVLPTALPGSVRTPNGTSVAVSYGQTYSNVHMTISEAIATMNGMLANHPSAQVVVSVSEATAAYNCHSYAWYSRLPNNNAWMENPTPYMTDGSYTQTIPAYADIVYWTVSPTNTTPVHSAVIEVPVSGTNEAIVISKWSYYGVVRHNQSDCPYQADSRCLTYWYR